MARLQFDVSSFRAQFPGLFPDPPNTDAFIEIFWGAAICYVSPDTSGSISEDCRRQILNLTTAHLISLMESAQAGNQAGFVVSASVGGISVSIQPPPSKNEFQFFFNQTIYGVQAYALLYAGGSGGIYLGGFNELGSFRRAGGVFSPPSTGDTSTGRVECPALIVAPLAPYTFDFGIIVPPAAVTQAVSVLPSCVVLTAAFSASFDDDVSLYLWSGLAADSGERFNIYYWTSDDVAAGNPPTQKAIGTNPTGLTSVDGFSLLGLKAGNLIGSPNTVAITGANNASTQALNFAVTVA